MKYFYVDANKQKAGPVSPEEFPSLGITEETLVWTKGMPQWTKAGQVPELADFFAALEEQAPSASTSPDSPLPSDGTSTKKTSDISTSAESQPSNPPRPQKNYTIVGVIAAVIVLVVGIVLYVCLNNSESPSQTPTDIALNDLQERTEESNSTDYEEEVLDFVEDEEIEVESYEDEFSDEAVSFEEQDETEEGNDEETNPVIDNELGSDSSNSNDENDVDDDRIYEMVEVNAQFPGGDEACMKWLQENIHYPATAQGQGVQGRVIVSFVVNLDGSIVDVEVVRSPDATLSQEALRVVKMMPKWKPARQDNKIVRSRFRLPVMFRLQ